MDTSFIITIITLLVVIILILIWAYIPLLFRFFRKGNIFNKLGTSDQIRLIHQLHEACAELKRKKIGALITLENKTPLEHLRTDGIVLNSNISAPILIAIFNKNSPLHDGAVIIKDMKIKYAGTFYKITQSSISNNYGARHRAALGISEQSDALTIIVSEETGNIHFVQNETIIKIPLNQFQTKLLEFLK